ncbi:MULTISPECIES: 5'-methylthioadenosine/S-adenosylhomocysteine nucleosidase [Bacillaceae]|uniref:5'-methylthioadenosine/S-adenosylhomocysteine nucleosidase n=2 Tax=Bacillaceae TaxID=186817 RepID=A0A090J2L5_9BACI|nr:MULTISPECIES: 5'-methylthioadenosine/S-adenosylhomocysteine nucleosidase [Bacillaceae]AWI12929.1 5'-methylthioadenosine/adenosylhomocysteine nucleosidase [Caldibacillus thermoamylovorans]KIO61150.1 5'-methylthioadenosine nucleosidase [Caldibacillus thermoamylovorans]KIO62832.1 5'-methylthioadenosine nucleosidase [Caldibacillus thermoamylovorans]KIO67448.1 5'-methylthioadenosine nucleosidase [Caldibacillus thermoamylovorans]KIO70243.1 5'-methylthioadenosine nucleosidase [Caldibacillus thermo
MKIAVIGAMEEEVIILRNQLENKKTEIIANSEFSSGTYGGKDVVLLKSGIGKVNAAMSTTILIERYHPDLIINTGSAGGLNPELNVGDLVISDDVCHHDVDATVFGYAYGQVPQMPAAYQADERLIQVAEEAARSLEGIQVKKGRIASGDSFMSDPDRVQMVAEKFPGLQAVEMEAAAIAQVAYQYGLPFVIIRALSDIAGKESDLSFEQFLQTAALNSANLVIEIIRKL